MLTQEAHRLLAGRYRLESILGQDVYALLYGATDLRLRRRVAVKMLRSESAGDPELRDRFKLEARTAASLSHPNVVAIHDTGDEDGIDYLVMEQLPGTTLAEELRAGPMSEGRVTEVGRQVLAALAAAHAAGIVHGALKPSSVVTWANGSVKVTDFGSPPSRTRPAVTRAATAAATVAHLAPERLAGEPASPAGDLYGAGAILYECLVGRPPFGGGSTAALVASIQGGGPVPVRALRPGADPALAAVIEQALDPRPDRRFASAATMSAALLSRLVPVTSTHPAPAVELPAPAATGRVLSPATSDRSVPPLATGAAVPPAPPGPVAAQTAPPAPRQSVPGAAARRESPAAVLLPGGPVSLLSRRQGEGAAGSGSGPAHHVRRGRAPSTRPRGPLARVMERIEGHFILVAVLAGAVMSTGLLIAALVGTGPSSGLNSRAVGSGGSRPAASAPAGNSAASPATGPPFGFGSLVVPRIQDRATPSRSKSSALVKFRSPNRKRGHRHRGRSRRHRSSTHHHRPAAHRHHRAPAVHHHHHRAPAVHHHHRAPAVHHHHHWAPAVHHHHHRAPAVRHHRAPAVRGHGTSPGHHDHRPTASLHHRSAPTHHHRPTAHHSRHAGRKLYDRHRHERDRRRQKLSPYFNFHLRFYVLLRFFF